MRRNLFLYLTLACFLGLLAIFVVDGYLGIYDVVYVTAGERTQKIEPDFWQRRDSIWWTGTAWTERVSFRYEIDNRRFSRYATNIEVSVWHSQQKISSLISQPVSIAAFDEEQLEWVIDTNKLLIGDTTMEQTYEYTVVVKRGGIERKIIVNVNPGAYPAKPVPVPAR